jgi:DNA-binding protein HU-beta
MRRKRLYYWAPIYASRCFLTQERDTLMATSSTSTATPTKVETVTLRQLAETLSESHELPKKQVMSMLEEMVTTVTKHLKRGARIRIGGLGILQVRKRPARMGRNPATGEAIKIKASKKVAFRAAKDLKEAV